MKLLDITPTLSIRKSFKVEQENPASVVLDIMASLDKLKNHRMPLAKSFKEELTSLATKFTEESIIKSITETGTLPVNLESNSYGVSFYDELVVKSNPVMDMFAKTPKASLEALRKVVNDTKMILAPFDFMEDKAYTGESFTVRSAIRNFHKESTKYNLKTFAVMPVKYLSIQKVIENYNPSMEIYAPNHRPYFDMLDMLMPVILMMNSKLKEMGIRLDNVESRLDAMDADMKSVVQSINNMSRQLARIQDNLKEQEIARKAVEQKLALAEQMRAVQWNWAMDPMLISVPENISIEGNGFAFIGPCWGPDFDDIMAALVEQDVIPKNKNMGDKILNIWG